MLCPMCGLEQPDRNVECSRCGVIFQKYFEFREAAAKGCSEAEAPQEERSGGYIDSLRELLFGVEQGVNPFYFGGRVLVFIIVLVWGWKCILTPMESNYVGMCFLHMVNLPFHEAGHIFFRPFGRLMTSLGGSLGQLLMPLICMSALLITSKDPFGASVCSWWVAENFMDIAPYINDARSLTLPLLGGVTGRELGYGAHDWEFILTELGWRRYDHILANGSYRLGTVLMLVSLAWGAYLLFKQYRNLDLN